MECQALQRFSFKLILGKPNDKYFEKNRKYHIYRSIYSNMGKLELFLRRMSNSQNLQRDKETVVIS